LLNITRTTNSLQPETRALPLFFQSLYIQTRVVMAEFLPDFDQLDLDEPFEFDERPYLFEHGVHGRTRTQSSLKLKSGRGERGSSNRQRNMSESS
ncbi:hypothetical protein P7M41_26480, partial [Vibrio parahaemolyticus]|nr:hypothetical protein [Vibrio parahaemolyticus]